MEIVALVLFAVLALRNSAQAGGVPKAGAGPKGGSAGGDSTIADLTRSGLGAGAAIVTALGGGGAAAAAGGGSTAATAAGGTAAAAGGVSAGVVVGAIIAFAAAIAGVVVGIMSAAQDFEALKNGAFGYMQTHLVTLAHEAAEKYRLRMIEAGVDPKKARAFGLLAGFAIARGYNRAAWAYIKIGASREIVLGVNVGTVGITPEFRHESYYVARSYGLPDEPGFITEPASVPPMPPNWQGAWPPPPPLLEGRQWDHTLEWYCFNGVNTSRAACLELAGADWTPEIEAGCDFLGRASRCAFSLHNKLVPGGQAANVPSTELAVRQYAQMGMIGLPPLNLPTGVHPTGQYPPGAETPVMDAAKQCVRQFTGQLAWYFNESIEFGVVPVRGYVA